MITLQEHLDALDRMVTQGTSVPELRSQIAFITREVAALEARHVSVQDGIAELQSAKAELQTQFDKQLKGIKAQLDAKIAEIKARERDAINNLAAQDAERQRRARSSHTLDHSA